MRVLDVPLWQERKAKGGKHCGGRWREGSRKMEEGKREGKDEGKISEGMFLSAWTEFCSRVSCKRKWGLCEYRCPYQ